MLTAHEEVENVVAPQSKQQHQSETRQRVPLSDRTNSNPGTNHPSIIGKSHPTDKSVTDHLSKSNVDIADNQSVDKATPDININIKKDIALVAPVATNMEDSSWLEIIPINEDSNHKLVMELQAALKETLEENYRLHEENHLLREKCVKLKETEQDLCTVTMLYKAAKDEIDDLTLAFSKLQTTETGTEKGDNDFTDDTTTNTIVL